MRRVAIIGANGQLGTDCQRAFEEAGDEVVALEHGGLEITESAAVDQVLAEVAPDVVVNTAALNNVEACEADPAKAFSINGIGPWNLARVAERLGIRLMHVSTDYVFDGAKRTPFAEDDLPRPLNVYGITKLCGEHFVLAAASNAVVVRTCGLYGRSPCRGKAGLNFVRRMLQLGRERGEVRVVTDEFVTPTYTLDLARQLVALADSDLTGIVHATAQGECSWYDFAEAIFAATSVPVRLEMADSSDFPAKVPRPTYSVLDNRRLRERGIDRMPHWRDSLLAYLEEIQELAGAVAAPGVRSG